MKFIVRIFTFADAITFMFEAILLFGQNKTAVQQCGVRKSAIHLLIFIVIFETLFGQVKWFDTQLMCLDCLFIIE